MDTFKITSVFLGAFGVMHVFLTFNVALTRRGTKVSLGAGENKLLERRIRGHANFCEVVPLGLLGLALFEAGVSDKLKFLTWIFGGILFLGRCIHAHGFNRPDEAMNMRVPAFLISMTALMCIYIGNFIIGIYRLSE